MDVEGVCQVLLARQRSREVSLTDFTAHQKGRLVDQSKNSLCRFLHLFRKYLLNTYCTYGIVLDIGSIVVSKSDTNPALVEIKF